MITTKETTLHAVVVPEIRRANILPRYIGVPAMIRFEASVFATMDEMCEEYRGGYWEFVEVSNGAFYMRLSESDPDKHFHLVQPNNYFDGDMSVDAAGIVVTMYALSALTFRTESDKHIELFHLLRNYAASHPEAQQILAAID